MKYLVNETKRIAIKESDENYCAIMHIYHWTKDDIIYSVSYNIIMTYNMILNCDENITFNPIKKRYKCLNSEYDEEEHEYLNGHIPVWKDEKCKICD